MDKREKQAESKVERCVVCGKPTEYCIDTPIGKRECYVEGAGQLSKLEMRERVERRVERNGAVGETG